MYARCKKFLFLALIAGIAACTSGAPTPSRAAVWQWSVPVAGGTDKAGPARAFLWIPQNCRKVRGIVFAQNNMEEEMILENPRFRQAMAQLDFAAIWVAPAFNIQFRFDQDAGDVFNGMINGLAAVSGYHELTFDPVVPIGHSAAASAPYYFAAWNPGRTLAAVSVSGQWPYFRSPVFAPDIWGDRNIDFIPSLETMGEYEAADSWATEGLADRQQHPLMPLSMAAGPAQSHFIAAAAKIDYLALYIRKAAQYRIPKGWTADAAPKLVPINPNKTGWLAERWRKDQPPTAAPAPVGQYQGDPKQAFWYFDGEMAKATEAYGAAYRGEKVDLLGYVQDGQVVPQTNSHLQVTLKFEPEADGVTFKLGSTFLDTVPGESPRPAGWTGLPAGSPVGHAEGGGPISIDRVVGPFEKIAPDTFAVRLQKETVGTESQYELVFAATHPGDDQYRPAVQQAHMYIPARNTAGADQHITFPIVPNQKVGVASVKLRATSDANVPISYYVREGPAEVQGDTLLLTAMPPGAKSPVAVTVVAWQYGRSVEPLLKTAHSVGCTFYLVKPGESAPPAHLTSLLPVPVAAPMGVAAVQPVALPPVPQTSARHAISFNICKALEMSAGDVAGAEARVGHWNNLKPGADGGSLTVAPVIGQDGKPEPDMTATVTGGSSEFHIYDGISDAGAGANDARLYNGVFDQFDGGATTVEVTHIPYAHYDVFFYRSDDGGNRAGKFTVGTNSLYVRGGRGNPAADGTGYVRSTSAAPGQGTDIAQGNYVEFENLSSATLSASFSAVGAGDGVQRNKLVGFQIVERK